MTSLSIRTRLTLWYGIVLAMTLVGCGTAVYLLLSYALMAGVDHGLEAKLEEIEEWIEEGTDVDDISWQDDYHRQPYVIRVKTPDGVALVESKTLRGTEISKATETGASRSFAHHIQSLPGKGPHRFLSSQVRSSVGNWSVEIGTSLEAYDSELAQLRVVLLTILPVGVLAAVGGGYWLAARALLPIQRITEASRRITAQSLSERILLVNPRDELGQLAATLNQMIDRLQHSFDAMRQFTADASHEFLTPLTAMRTETEVSLRADRPAEHYRCVLVSILEEIERLTKLADSLLLLSREDARATPLKLEPVQLDELIREMAEHMRPLAQEREVDLQVGPLAAVTVEVDVGCLRQVLFNLLDNAVKYTGPAGSVSVASRVEDNTAVIEVSDTGIGIPTESLPRVFDRFYRVDKSRSRQLGGTGLGLSICKALVERHGGRIEVQSVVDRGSTFRVVLPSSIRSFS